VAESEAEAESESGSDSEPNEPRKAEDDEAREDANDEREDASDEGEGASTSDEDASDEDASDEDASDEDASSSEDDEGASESSAKEDSDSDSDSDSDDGATKSDSSAKSDDDPPKKSSKIWWLLPIAVIVEFWIYGHNGYLDVCVGKEGQTDFALAGAERTDDNRWKFPRCETELNLGLRSEYDDKVAAATKVACRGATLFRNRGEAAQCERQEDGWQRQVDARFCPPWDPNYYEHLFWFLK